MTITLLDIVVIQIDTFVCTLIFETNNVMLSPKYNIFELGYCVGGISNVSRSVRKPEVSPGELSCI